MAEDVNEAFDCIEEARRRLVGAWLDVEALVWDRSAGFIRAPFGPGDTTVKWGIGATRAPQSYTHRLIIRRVLGVDITHEGDYPWAQAIRALRFDRSEGELLIELSAKSVVRVRVETPEMEMVALPEA